MLVYIQHLRSFSPPLAPAPARKVVVSVETGHFFGDYERVVPCSIPCEFKRSVPKADAKWYHLCAGEVTRDFPAQSLIVMSMESSVNYPCLSNSETMDQFDIKATYRMDSDVPLPYLMPEHILYFSRPIVWGQENSVVFLQGNCGSKSGREDVVTKLIELSQNRSWKVESRGACLNNAAPFPRGLDKKDGLKKYKFALTFENSLDDYYVTEKVWDALAAGSLPIYHGAPEILDYVPSPDSIIDYRQLKTPEALADYLDILVANDTLYAKHLEWRYMPLSKLSPGYQQLVRLARGEHSQCNMCKLVAARRDIHFPI